MSVDGRLTPGLALLLPVEIPFQCIDGVRVVDIPVVFLGLEVEVLLAELRHCGIVVLLKRVDEAPEAVIVEPLVGRLLGLGVEAVGPHGRGDGVPICVDETIAVQQRPRGLVLVSE